MSRKVRLRKGSKIENEQEGEIENLTNCDCQQESSCGFVARGENTHRVDDRDDPVLNIAIVIMISMIIIVTISMITVVKQMVMDKEAF